MGSPFSRLAGLVEGGSIKIIELQAVPRSMSTALGRCLNESASTSVFIDEPFNMRIGDVNIAAGHILGAVESVLSSAHEPVIVISKSMAPYLSTSAFRAWTDVCSAVVWCIRHPRAQISSLVTRLANDILCGVGSDRLKQSDLLPPPLSRSPAWPGALEIVTEFLQNSRWSTNFSATGWRAIGGHFTDYAGRRPSFVADGSLFSRVPDRFLRYLCSGLGIQFCERMIDGWREPFFNANRLDNHPNLADSANAWVKHAAISRGIEATDRDPLEVCILPTALRDHVLEVALPTYEMLMRAFYSQPIVYGVDPQQFR
ncbi:hypothetical protein [uncultured Mycobacterium sp.]|uniref:hypothetical protein n=1 Tax=uncultured Mycobacterium sp. TaxID=171292 RepID=UPI0035CADBFB